MKTLRCLLMVNAILFGVSGLGAIFFPEKVLMLYGVDTGAASFLMAQYAGLGSFAIALLTWMTRYIEDSKALRGIVIALAVTYFIGTIISILGVISGVMTIGWPVVALYALFTLVYTYFLFALKYHG